MALAYLLKEKMEPVDRSSIRNDDCPYVEVLSQEEFDAMSSPVDDDTRRSIALLAQAESCYVEFDVDNIIGSIAAPDKKDLMGDRDLFSFYLTRERLVFIDEGSMVSSILEKVANSRLSRNLTTPLCLYEFLRQMLEGDPTWLGQLEDKMEDAEDTMLDDNEEVPLEDLNAFRRVIIRMTAYYEQFAVMLQALSTNENGMLEPGEADDFAALDGYMDRLISRAETIREYSLQLRELRQTQMDMQQNNTMQLLTIVTVLFAPLTLIAGWFGMNFANIPGINEPWGFAVACIVGLVITIFLIFWFRRKKWL